MLFVSVFLIFVLGLKLSSGVPVDNGVEGDPEIECGSNQIIINVNTQNAFEGNIYVQGLHNNPECRSDQRGRAVAGITLDFNTCGISRVRSLNPRGVFVTTTIIVSFHPLFLTKVDRAYKIQCFYMEADKTVDTELEVSVLTTGPQEFSQGVAIMPICRYEILDGSPSAPPIDFAIVGQQVYHKWTCDTETVETFCMIVHSCYVDDFAGDRVDLVGPDGCAIDVYLLNNPEYLTDLMAGVEAHVFKYADRSQLYFQCQVAILIKEPGTDCPRPNCPTPPGRGGPRPAGPAPPASANSWPLVPGSPYLPTGGQVAPRPSFQAPAARPASGPAATGRGPTARRPLSFGHRRPGFNVPLRRSRKHKRDVGEEVEIEFDDLVAGTLDVKADMTTLDLDENLQALPDKLLNARRHMYGITQLSAEDGFCVSNTLFVTFLVLVIVVILSLVSVLLFLKFRTTKTRK